MDVADDFRRKVPDGAGHLFLGGIGLGGQVAADLVSARGRVDGLFLMAYPLHPPAGLA